MLPLVLLPLISLLLLTISIWLMVKVRIRNISKIFLVINGISLFVLLTIFIIYTITNNLTFVAPWIYWLILFVGIITGIISVVKKFIPGQIMSAGLLLFTAYVTLFSIGIIILVLFIFQCIFIIVNWKRYGLGIA